MFRKLSQALALFLILVMISACSGSRISARIYSEDKARVDQEMNGNAGYIMGTPKVPIEPPAKKTRKVYILEVTKALDEPPSDKELYGMDLSNEIGDANYQLPPRRKIQKIPTSPKISLPKFEEEAFTDTKEAQPAWGSFTQYKVEEKDTLQKISKKFYNTYSKWHIIYEANKDLIKDPNFIKPGITINIPNMK